MAAGRNAMDERPHPRVEPIMTGSGQTPTEPGLWPAHGDDVIELTVPAQTSYLGVVRTATAGLAARLSLTHDEIEDLRMAVDEACMILLGLPTPQPQQEPTLTCRFRVLDEALAVEISTTVADTTQFSVGQSFAWRVLITHAAEVSASTAEGTASINLVKRRGRA